jgi:hypothetical protein
MSWCAETKELQAKRGSIFLLGRFGLVAKLLFAEVCRFPSIDLRDRMIDRGESLFIPNGGDPIFDARLLIVLHLVEFAIFSFHNLSPK